MKAKGLAGIVGAYILIVGGFLAAVYWASLATTAVAQLIPLDRENVIVIDPGHGGVDGGATSCTGILESKMNLDISLKLQDLFQLLGYKTTMIRTEDVSVHTSGETIAAKKVSDLRQRVSLVNATPDAVLLSIHQNSFPDSRYSGPQVFYGPAGDGQMLAYAVQEALNENLAGNRVCKRAEGIYLLQNIRCTGVLVECGFLSNPEEEALLRDFSYQQKLSCVIAAGVCNFLDG